MVSVERGATHGPAHDSFIEFIDVEVELESALSGLSEANHPKSQIKQPTPCFWSLHTPLQKALDRAIDFCPAPDGCVSEQVSFQPEVSTLSRFRRTSVLAE
jgi:hypothetical protein